ncbi:phage repressor protein CI [Escherichia coli]|uniref:phage repressor protein CI n=1 Tax=Escherichia coli TaxID=562 RepID=UPI000542D507|nr:phage repressor protein CI [Escherichia coli]EFH2820676.1 phage repressor protein [Escherichia coli]EFN7417511.1 phage repressor protein [Escherichia coli]EFN8029823.1 phage repressor protein [Escherichia coli]EFP2286860.1 phage repressor protein [Escherichia coli]EFU8381419.1 phage repressor protein [Escherichia coli]
MDLRKGGKAAIERMLEAYGVTTKQALCERLGISSSTLANRYLRDTFPADYIIQCALETGVSLKWLVTGNGSKTLGSTSSNSVKELQSYILKNGVLVEDGLVTFDDKLLPVGFDNLHVIRDIKTIHFVDCSNANYSDGTWLISIDGNLSFRKVYRMPAGQLKIENNLTSFISNVSDISLKGRVVSTIESQI